MPSIANKVVVLRTAAALAVGAPGDDDRHLLGSRRTEDVDIDRYAVAQRDRDVALEHDVARQRAERRRDLVTGRQGRGAGLEGGEQTVLALVKGVGFDEYLFGVHLAGPSSPRRSSVRDKLCY